jgi:phenylacetate-CoA ligase
VRFYNWYGHSEKLVLAGYCRHTHHYHAEPTYGYFELVDKMGRVIRKKGAVGEIVGTSFHNPGMPFIRYKTGDFAEYVGNHCEACGRTLPVFRAVRGRWSGERIFNADGNFVTTTALNLHNELFQVINGLQYVQPRKGALIVLIIKSPLYTQSHETALYDHFKGKLDADTEVVIRYVERLLRRPNGKFVQLISRLNEEGIETSLEANKDEWLESIGLSA